MRIGAAYKVVIFLQHKRSIKLRGAGYDEFCRLPRRIQRRTRTSSGHRLARAAMRTENIVGCNAATAKTTEDCLHLRSFAADLRRSAVGYLSVHQFLQMRSQRVAHLTGGRETIFRFVFNRTHQDLFHLAGDRGRYLAWPRIFLKVKNQKRIVLRIRSGNQVKHRRTQTVNVGARLDSSTEKLWWRITHCAY